MKLNNTFLIGLAAGFAVYHFFIAHPKNQAPPTLPPTLPPFNPTVLAPAGGTMGNLYV